MSAVVLHMTAESHHATLADLSAGAAWYSRNRRNDALDGIRTLGEPLLVGTYMHVSRHNSQRIDQPAGTGLDWYRAVIYRQLPDGSLETHWRKFAGDDAAFEAVEFGRGLAVSSWDQAVALMAEYGAPPMPTPEART